MIERAALSFSVMLLGCAAEPVVVVGTGATSFEELDPGGEVELAAGPQGGYHVFLGVRCQALGPTVMVEYGVDDAETGEELSFSGLSRSVELQENGGWWEYAPLVGFLRGSTPDPYVNRDVRLRVTVSDDTSPPVTESVQVTIRDAQ